MSFLSTRCQCVIRMRSIILSTRCQCVVRMRIYVLSTGCQCVMRMNSIIFVHQVSVCNENEKCYFRPPGVSVE